MQLPLRPPNSPEEQELIKARTRQANVITWLSSLSFGALFLMLALPVCVLCLGCLIALVMTGAVAVSWPSP